jgi:hypothetical protein
MNFDFCMAAFFARLVLIPEGGYGTNGALMLCFSKDQV